MHRAIARLVTKVRKPEGKLWWVFDTKKLKAIIQNLL